MPKHFPTALLAVIMLASSAAAQETVIVPQPDAPLRITAYKAAFQERSTYRTEGIRHEIEYMNASDKEVMACQIGLVSFDVFNNFLDRTGGVDMTRLRPGETKKGAWVATAYADFSFYTGVAYVGKVRFADGTIWEADLQAVTAAIREIEEDFDASRLTADERPGGTRNR